MSRLTIDKTCEGYDGYACDVNLRGRHVSTKRCPDCAKVARLQDKSYESMYATDTLTVQGAQKLKRQIENYWATRGKSVRVSFEKGPFSPNIRYAPTFIRSDLINGLPQTGATK